MLKINKWTNSIFCFRVSVLFVLIWLAISSAICLIFYFTFGSEDFADGSIISFSTWLFVVPAIIFFGLINTIPLIIDWATKPLDLKEQPLEQEPKNNEEPTRHVVSISNINTQTNVQQIHLKQKEQEHERK
jgi:hypothetical protein